MYHITDGGRKEQGTNIISLLGRENKGEGKGRPARGECDIKTSVEEKRKGKATKNNSKRERKHEEKISL